MVNLQERFESYQKNVTPEFLKFLAETVNVSESDLKFLGIGFDTYEQAVVFADCAPTGEITNLIRWFRGNERRSLVADEGRIIHILTESVPGYIKAKVTENLLHHPHASFVAKQVLKEIWTGIDGKPTLDYYEDSYWEWRNDHYCRLKPDILNSKLLAYLKDKYYLEKKDVQGGIIVACRKYICTKYQLRQVRWCLKHEVLDRNNLQEKQKKVEEHTQQLVLERVVG